MFSHDDNNEYWCWFSCSPLVVDSKLSFHMWKLLISLYNYTNRKLHFVTCFYATKSVVCNYFGNYTTLLIA
jgi:hypothetical protein